MKVSEVVNDFDNTYNKIDDDSFREMMIDGEVCSSLPFNYIKYRMMEGSILRAMNEQRASNEITSNV